MEEITPEKLLLRVVLVLDRLGIKYFITGGYAISVWGRPRATFDIDIVVKLVEPQAESLAKALRQISKAGYIDEDIAREAVRKKGEFNFIDPNSGLKVDFWVAKSDKRAETEYKRRAIKKINNQKVYFISPEDLVLSKLNWYQQTQSDRHLEDVESIFKITKKLDLRYLKRQASNCGALEILNKILKNKALWTKNYLTI